VEAQVRLGIPTEDARTYLPIGCYEPAVEGKEIGCTMNIYANLAKMVVLALHDGVDPKTGIRLGPETGDPRAYQSFEELWAAFQTQMSAFLTQSNLCIRAAETEWPQINPSPLLAGAVEDCLGRGLDVGQGGATYNSVGYVGTGLANACDSLVAIEQAVFQDRHCTMDQLLEAMDRDFKGQEPMRQYLLRRTPKWGNHDPKADRMARRIADTYCAGVHAMSNARGGRCRASLFSLEFAWKGGQMVEALPDGRREGESLAPGMGPSYGCDRHGVTGIIGSVTGIDAAELPNGAVLDLTLHPSAVRGETGLDAMVALIKAFFRQGGYAVQFNIYDVETLRQAQRTPEKYSTLQIRLTGWSVYFTTLTPFEQEQFISRTTQRL
jgi:formate C-acetyltransferase